jgi:hypothetical protein
MAYEEPTAFQIHAVLDGVEPPIWRRLVVPLSFNLKQLHHVLQAAFGWTDSHLHEYRIGGLRFGDADFAESERFEGDMRTFEEADVTLNDFSREPETKFNYVYDFGDHWVHVVTLEKLAAISPTPKVATCIDGARCCPPEDVGGTSGYENFLRVLLTPEEDEMEEHEHIRRWSGGKFDPERFDLVRTDKAVRGTLHKRAS